jgi:hypothetical protein
MVVPNLSMVVGMPVVFAGVATSQKIVFAAMVTRFQGG